MDLVPAHTQSTLNPAVGRPMRRWGRGSPMHNVLETVILDREDVRNETPNVMQIGIGCFAAIIAAVWSACASAADCVMENDLLDLYGVITREVLPGAHDNRDVRRADSAGIAFIITTDAPYDICAEDRFAGGSKAARRVVRFQLFRSPDLELTELPVVFGRVHARGTFTSGITGPNDTPVAVEVRELRNLGAWAPKAMPPAVYPVVYVPVTITFSRRLVGHGHVARLTNQSKSPIAVFAGVSNPTTNANKLIELKIPAHAARSIGDGQGLALQTGDRLLLHVESFTDVAVQVP